MTYPVAHPYGQLQFELPGVPALTAEQQTAEWLESLDDPWTLRAVDAFLRIEDHESRPTRASRRLRVWYLQNALPEAGFPMIGGVENVWLYHESLLCYVGERDVAAMLCAHALCERSIAGFLELHDLLNDRLRRAGLGPVVEAAHKAGFIDQNLLDDLQAVNEIRKALAHLRRHSR